MGATISSLAYYFLFEYDTPKIVHIKSKLVGLINRLIQLLIIAYIIGWVIVYKHGYQEFSPLQSSVTTKVKGAVYTKHPKEFNSYFQNDLVKRAYDRVWDVADYIIPPQENGAFFVMTNAIITPNQTLGETATVPVVNETICDPNDYNDTCVEGKTAADSNGVMTGNCVYYNSTYYTCEVHAWHPLEVDELIPPYNEKPLLQGTENFTVLIKNSISFHLWPTTKTRNILQSANNSSYLKKCTFDAIENELCPIFKLSTIVEKAQEKQNYTELATIGAVMGIIINWDCNLDYNIEKCKPNYQFRRLDDKDVKIARGWNFRFAHYYGDSNRTLYKAYGILFVVMVEGQGRKFNMVPLMLNVGSGLALLSIAVIICDVIALYCTRKRDYYREKKYLIVNDNSDLSGLVGNDQLDEQNQYDTFAIGK